jgi:hypothetical protein
MIFTYSNQINWKGLKGKGRLVDGQTKNLTYWMSTPSICVDPPLPTTNASIYHINIKINKTLDTILYFFYCCTALSLGNVQWIALVRTYLCKSPKLDIQTSWQTGNKWGFRFINQRKKKKKKIIGSIYRSQEQ